jgi:hypothetical protein
MVKISMIRKPWGNAARGGPELAYGVCGLVGIDPLSAWVISQVEIADQGSGKNVQPAQIAG